MGERGSGREWASVDEYVAVLLNGRVSEQACTRLGLQANKLIGKRSAIGQRRCVECATERIGKKRETSTSCAGAVVSPDTVVDMPVVASVCITSVKSPMILT